MILVLYTLFETTKNKLSLEQAILVRVMNISHQKIQQNVPNVKNPAATIAIMQNTVLDICLHELWKLEIKTWYIIIISDYRDMARSHDYICH